MNVTIESFFCPYCDEVAEIFLRLIDTILLAGNHFWVHQRKVSDPTQQFRHRLLKAEF